MTPITHRASDEFDERNHFLSVCLGLLSLATRVEADLDAALPALAGDEEDEACDARGGGGCAPRRGDGDAVVDAFLGLIAVARRVRWHFASLPESLLVPETLERPAVAAPAEAGARLAGAAQELAGSLRELRR